MSNNALCFKCGVPKKDARQLCGRCMAIPRTFDDLVLSFCLSEECVKTETLKKCKAYFKRKNKPPRFRPSVINAASVLAQEHAGRDEQSIEFSSALFEFSDLNDGSEETGLRSINVQVIGRLKGHPDSKPPNGVSGEKTWHRETWVIGQDVSDEDVRAYIDGDQLFVWYRWINDRWAWSCVSRGRFSQLKALEDGQTH